MNEEVSFVAASEEELNDLVEGRLNGSIVRWTGGRPPMRLRPNDVGVLLADPKIEAVARPLALVVAADDQRRLFTRFAQLRGDLSPLSAWCHVLSPDRLEALDGPVRSASLGRLAAAWVGLVVAESLLLAERSVSKLKIAACLSTQSFAIARSKALWGKVSTAEVLERHSQALRLARSGDHRENRLREAFAPIWGALSAASSPGLPVEPTLSRLRDALLALDEVRTGERSEEAVTLHRSFSDLEEAAFLLTLSSLTPENRVRTFDRLVEALDRAAPRDRSRMQALQFIAGYLATVIAGGGPSLGITDASSKRWPEITAWAYAIGGVGERVVWTSSFEGLGRLIARELSRPLRLNDPPSCDFGLDEALVLVDRQLSDPLVHLRIKQMRVATVAILPGVNIAVPMSESAVVEQQRDRSEVKSAAAQPDRGGAPATEDQRVLSMLADALWPHLVERLTEKRPATAPERVPVKRRRSGATGKLI